MPGSVYEVISTVSPFPILSTHQRHAFLLKKIFNWFTKELQTTLKLIFVQKRGGEAPKYPETKGRRHKKGRYKRAGRN